MMAVAAPRRIPVQRQWIGASIMLALGWAMVAAACAAPVALIVGLPFFPTAPSSPRWLDSIGPLVGVGMVACCIGMGVWGTLWAIEQLRTEFTTEGLYRPRLWRSATHLRWADVRAVTSDSGLLWLWTPEGIVRVSRQCLRHAERLEGEIMRLIPDPEERRAEAQRDARTRPPEVIRAPVPLLGWTRARFDDTGLAKPGLVRDLELCWSEVTWMGVNARNIVLETPRRSVSIPLLRLRNPAAAVEYIRAHVPPAALGLAGGVAKRPAVRIVKHELDRPLHIERNPLGLVRELVGALMLVGVGLLFACWAVWLGIDRLRGVWNAPIPDALGFGLCTVLGLGGLVLGVYLMSLPLADYCTAYTERGCRRFSWRGTVAIEWQTVTLVWHVGKARRQWLAVAAPSGSIIVRYSLLKHPVELVAEVERRVPAAALREEFSAAH